MVFSDIQEAWIFLVSCKHQKFTIDSITYFQWYFYDNEKNIYKLEHQAGIIVKRFIINRWFLTKNQNDVNTIYDIIECINKYKEDIENTQNYYDNNTNLKNKILEMIGEYTYYTEPHIEWKVSFEKIKIHIALNMFLNNNNMKEITLQYDLKDGNGLKTKIMMANELINFLQEHKPQDENMFLVEKIHNLNLENPILQDNSNDLVNNFSKLKLNSPKFYNENMTHIYSRISNEYKYLFIKMDKERSYQIQACKKF